MAYKLGLLLSMVFVMQLFVFAGDMMSLQAIYTNLDAVSVVAGNLISTRGQIDDEIRYIVASQSGGIITSQATEAPKFGSVYAFEISRDFDPWVISNKPIRVSVKRSVVIGYYL